MSSVSTSGITPAQIQNSDLSVVTILRSLLNQRSTLLHDNAASMSGLLKTSNDGIKELSTLLVKAQNDKENEVDLDDDGRHDDYEPILKKYGHVTDEKLFVYDSGDYWDANIAYIQGLLDKETATASRLSTALQNLTSKYNNAIEITKSFIDDHNNNARSIISSF